MIRLVEGETGAVTWDGRRSHLPAAPRPGEQISVTAALLVPAEAGPYRLQWDLVAEGVAWFSERGAAPLELEIRVG